MSSLKPLTIFLTGACGVTSRSVVRALKLSPHFGNARFVGTDVCENIFGLHEGLFERIYRVPRCTDPDYSGMVLNIIHRENVDAAIVIPELEVLHWTRVGLPVPCILPPPGFSDTVISKARLHDALAGTGLVPTHKLLSREELLGEKFDSPIGWPAWVRDYEPGSTSGKGALLVNHPEEVRAWVSLNPGIGSFMIAEYLPGLNYACHLLYYEGKLLKTATYERIEYFMGRTVMSGISGNISRGKVLHDEEVFERSRTAVEKICASTGEKMHGLVSVDMRGNTKGEPMITEINLRHVACTSAFASAGFNLCEAQLFAAFNQPEKAGDVFGDFPPHNTILRDIDGIALWVPDGRPPEIGGYVDCRA